MRQEKIKEEFRTVVIESLFTVVIDVAIATTNKIVAINISMETVLSLLQWIH